MHTRDPSGAAFHVFIPSCKNVNWAHRQMCHRCNAPRDTQSGKREQELGGSERERERAYHDRSAGGWSGRDSDRKYEKRDDRSYERRFDRSYGRRNGGSLERRDDRRDAGRLDRSYDRTDARTLPRDDGRRETRRDARGSAQQEPGRNDRRESSDYGRQSDRREGRGYDRRADRWSDRRGSSPSAHDAAPHAPRGYQEADLPRAREWRDTRGERERDAEWRRQGSNCELGEYRE